MKSLVSEIAKKAFENSDSPSIFTDEYGFIVWCNQAFERISEYTLSEVKGKRPGQILQGSESDPKKVQVMKEAVANARAFELEIDNYTKSGKKYRTQISCEPVFDDSNLHIGFFSIQPTVTRKKLIDQRKLVEATKLLEAIFNNAQVAVIIADDDMIVRRANPYACNMLGYKRDELLGMTVLDYTRKVALSENLWNEFMDKEMQIGEIELLHKSGRVIYGEYKAVSDVLPGKHLSVITDITEKKEKEREILMKNKQLALANESMKTLFSIIGHDLREPLANLQQALELLDRPEVKPEEYKVFFEGISKNLDANKWMLNNLLSWAKQQQDGFKLDIKKIDLVELINNIFILHQERAKRKGIELKLEVSSKSIFLNSDKEALSLVLRNLCSNAIKFTSNGDVIKLRLADDVKSIRFEVSDTGNRISSENIDKIFSTGYTTRGSKLEKGTGLGLTLCNEFLASLDSKLEVESTLGKGTTFYFDLAK
ncbi:MAG: PAS domain-containing sensor histidine kinase [Winogradskyella sp.]|uniref:PAS domain-containing sensor histidine kinase n=1 Tax=Winogradskyella sp. TaxID=1883156 RepID=UPI0025F2463C|nr:PAS domain-containing sensor histidine kinase [Winogradskyella sp.]NRB60330.1 PAS domain-containing sensor histidine kinase [Winogradskyella sp.]